MSETVRIQEMQILRFVQFGIQIRNVLSDFESSHQLQRCQFVSNITKFKKPKHYMLQIPLYGHPLNTDTSLLRIVCFALGKRKPFFFSSFNPLNTDTFYCPSVPVLTMQFRRTTVSAVSTTKDTLIGSENPFRLMRLNLGGGGGGEVGNFRAAGIFFL